ncbi:hypothetical protein SNEBB_009890 [Seison nebaliae]|nr:hypothetical protein SNEBB_009890 [Seison nebaliae]
MSDLPPTNDNMKSMFDDALDEYNNLKSSKLHASSESNINKNEVAGYDDKNLFEQFRTCFKDMNNIVDKPPHENQEEKSSSNFAVDKEEIKEKSPAFEAQKLLGDLLTEKNFSEDNFQFPPDMENVLLNNLMKNNTENDDGLSNTNELFNYVLYPSLKYASEKFPKYLKDNEMTLTQTQLGNYRKQHELMGTIIVEYEKPNYNYETILELIQQMREYGSPPKELTENLIDSKDSSSTSLSSLFENCMQVENQCPIS